MKDNVVTILWGACTLIFGVLTSQLDGSESTVEKFSLGLLFAQIILGIYLLLVLGFNCLIGNIKFRFKLPPPKRFLTKVTPIYKVSVYEEVENYFNISKYELAWIDFCSGNYRFWLLPFCGLFQIYKYQPIGFYAFEQKLEEGIDIGAMYEVKFAEENKKQIEERTAEQKELDKIDKLNKTFLENYEK